MSRRNNKKPVGFATHLTAGGIAGGIEAVSQKGATKGQEVDNILVMLSTFGHHQSSDAALQVWTCSWGASASCVRMNSVSQGCLDESKGVLCYWCIYHAA